MLFVFGEGVLFIIGVVVVFLGVGGFVFSIVDIESGKGGCVGGVFGVCCVGR